MKKWSKVKRGSDNIIYNLKYTTWQLLNNRVNFSTLVFTDTVNWIRPLNWHILNRGPEILFYAKEYWYHQMAKEDEQKNKICSLEISTTVTITTHSSENTEYAYDCIKCDLLGHWDTLIMLSTKSLNPIHLWGQFSLPVRFQERQECSTFTRCTPYVHGIVVWGTYKACHELNTFCWQCVGYVRCRMLSLSMDHEQKVLTNCTTGNMGIVTKEETRVCCCGYVTTLPPEM